MIKIPTIFLRDPQNLATVTANKNPDAEWVFRGEGIPTRKFDGTAIRVRNGKLYKRYDCKTGRIPPELFEPADIPDPITGHWPGWVPVTPADKYVLEGYHNSLATNPATTLELKDGTYELCGPKINGNPEGFNRHLLIIHGQELLTDVGRDYESIRHFLANGLVEGIVYHHLDGRMAKIKTRDFGFKRK